MKKFLVMIAALLCLNAAAQTNITLSILSIHPSPTLTNYNRINLTVTNITPNALYLLVATRRLTIPFINYVAFISPSNSIFLPRDTTNAISVRFYRVQSTNAPTGFSPGTYFVSGPSEWDDHDFPGDDSDVYTGAGGGGDINPFMSFFLGLPTADSDDISDPVPEVILPPPLRANK